MQKIPISLAEPGMIIAKPIVNDKGIQLVAEQTELTPTILERLRKMQIAHVTVVGAQPETAANDAAVAEDVRALNERFGRVKGDPLMERVRAAIEQAIISRGDGAGKAAS